MQQPKRFQAPTLAEAYDQVRRDLGDGAVILSTRKAFAPGLFGQPGRQFVEVVARVPETAEERPTLDQDQAAHDLVRAVAEAAATAPAAASGPFAGFQRGGALAAVAGGGPAGESEDAPAPAPTRVPQGVPGASWARQLDQMRGMLEELLAERMDARLEASPAGMRVMRERLVRHGMPGALATTLLSEVDARDGSEGAVAAAVERRLAAKMPPAASLNLSRRRAIFLVGPSGAGKTTMAVRLALQLQRQGLSVVIAGTDVNRAGAPQQLLAFGAVTGLEVRLCYSPDELAEVVADREVDAVVIDTPGHNGMRRDRMAELDSFLQAARQRTVLLTLPATMKASDLAETVAAYSGTGVDGLVLARCDETAHFGALAGLAVEAAIGVAFTTHSDQVSDPAEAGDNAALAAAAVRAAWPSTPVGLAAAEGGEGDDGADDEGDAAAASASRGRRAAGARRRLARVG